MDDSWSHPWKIDVASHTDVGKVRERNEDAARVCEEPALFAVADGMGGHRAGDRASRLAVDLLHDAVKESWQDGGGDGRVVDLLRDVFETVNRRIIDDASGRADRMGMGTTLTALLLAGSDYVIGHVGDSRALRVRDGSAEQLTDDHSIVAAQVREGGMSAEEARVHPMRHVLSRCMGAEPAPRVDVLQGEVRDGDVFVLGSDGLTGALDPEEIAETVSEADDARAASQKLVEKAKRLDGSDNITAVVIACHSHGE